MKEYAVNIRINNFENKGKIILDSNDIILQVYNQEKRISYCDFSRCYHHIDNKIVIVLKNGISIVIESIDYKEILNYICGKVDNRANDNMIIPNGKLGQLLQYILNKPYLILVICCFLLFLKIPRIIRLLLFLPIILSLVLIVRKILKKESEENSSKSFLKNPIFHLVLGFFLIPFSYNSLITESTFFRNISFMISSVAFFLIVISLIRIIIRFYKGVVDSFFSKNRRDNFLYRLILFGLPVVFIVVTIIYHNTGPEGAVNSTLGGTLVSCKNEGKALGVTTYTCYGKGRECEVACKDRKCAAICER